MSSKDSKPVMVFTKKNKKGNFNMSSDENKQVPAGPDTDISETKKVADTTDDKANVPGDVAESVSQKVTLPIHDDFELPQAMLNSIEKQTEEAMPRLALGVPYTTKKICGRDFWTLLTTGEKILAGICMAHLVKTNRVPLVEAGANSSHSKLYELK